MPLNQSPFLLLFPSQEVVRITALKHLFADGSKDKGAKAILAARDKGNWVSSKQELERFGILAENVDERAIFTVV